MGSMFSKPKVPEPVVVPPPPAATLTTEDDSSIKEAATREAEKIKKRKGGARTIFTGPEGLSESPNVLKEKLGE